MTMNTSFSQTGCHRCHAFLPDLVPYLFRPHDKPGKSNRDPIPTTEDHPLEETADAVVCRNCLHVITFSNEHRVINGAHIHTFANPEGIIFEIGCYGDAQGCGYVGPLSSEFTWFAGYLWRIAVCSNCLIHLGWRFSGADGHFFHGLITSRLAVKSA
jgi:hypothetical protein